MPITVRCPNPACTVTATVSEALTGRTVRCRKCGTPFRAGPTLDGGRSDTAKSRPTAAAADPFPTLPAEFGRYRVVTKLGQGGMGAVYLAEDTQLGRRVALKLPFFRPDDAVRAERFDREARAAAALHHPGVCTVFDVGRIDGRPFLSMAYLDGTSLDRVIDPDQPLPPRRAADLVRQIARAIAYAHRNGVVHRDLKPANVILTAAGDPVVMDFGLAKRVGEADEASKLTHDGAVLGTPAYMAPEQVRGEQSRVGPATDGYALGVLLFELLAGRVPYTGPFGVVMGQILHAPVPAVREVRPDVPPPLDAICRRAMAKTPADRFPDLDAFVAALDDYLASSEPAAPTVTAAPVPLAPLAKPVTARRGKAARRLPGWVGPAAIGAGLFALVVAVTAGVVLVMQPRNPAVASGRSEPTVKADAPGTGEPPAVGATADDPRPPATEPKELEPDPEPAVPVPPVPSPGFVSLFNGKDLSGWSVASGDEGAWKVRLGELVGTAPAAGADSWLLTDAEYGDFVVQFEYRHLRAAETSGGVMVRLDPTDKEFLPVKLMDDAGRSRAEVENGEMTGTFWVRNSSGQLINLSPGRPAKLKPGNGWNRAELAARGANITLTVNGEVVQSLDLAPYAKAAGADPLTRPRGRVGLQARTGVTHFRNVEVKPDPPTRDGFVRLFNGKDLAGWKTHPNQPGGWKVVDGVLTGSGDGVSHLYTDRADYTEFHLRAECRINDGGNSGVLGCTQFGPRLPADRPLYPGGFEAQICGSASDPTRTGSLYLDDAVVDRAAAAPPAGRWFTLEMVVVGARVTVLVDGKVTADFLDGKLRHPRGHIALEQHGAATVCEFRTIEVKEPKAGSK